MKTSLLKENELAPGAPASADPSWAVPDSGVAMAAPRRPRPWSRPWFRVALACLLLGLSAAARAWQDRRFEAEARSSLAVPFKLATLPTTIGPWEAIERDLKFDPETLQITGATDYILRTYADKRTGVEVGLLVLFGPGGRVGAHTPEVCYPSCGFENEDEPTTVALHQDQAPGRFRGQFRGASYRRERGGELRREESFYSFRYVNAAGKWDPRPLSSGNLKQNRHSPGLLKVQVLRILSERERTAEDGPCQQFLRMIVPRIEEAMTAPRRRS